jgi:hypothetical protein
VAGPGSIRAHLGSAHVTRVIYGAIVGLAIVVALEPHPPDAATVAVILVTTAIAVALAELYSNVVGTRLRTHGPLGGPRRRDAALDVVAVALGGAFPALFFVLSAAGAIELDTAFDIAKWSGLGFLGCFGFAAAHLSGAGTGRSLLHALAVGAIGAAVILIKSLVH